MEGRYPSPMKRNTNPWVAGISGLVYLAGAAGTAYVGETKHYWPIYGATLVCLGAAIISAWNTVRYVRGKVS